MPEVRGSSFVQITFRKLVGFSRDVFWLGVVVFCLTVVPLEVYSWFHGRSFVWAMVQAYGAGEFRDRNDVN